MPREVKLKNGTKITVGPSWVVTTLPNGMVVHAHTDESSEHMAKELGYKTVEELTICHDILHSLLMDWLNMPYSYSLMNAAGCEVDQHISNYEEEAVLAIHRILNSVENRT